MALTLLSVPGAHSLLDGAPASRSRPEPPSRAAANAVFRARPPARWRLAAAATEMAPAAARAEDRSKTFMEEMRAAAMRLHTREQDRGGEKEKPMEPPVADWQPTVEGYLRFLVDNKLVFETLEAIVHRASIPWYAEFRNTGLERSEPLRKDLEWFRQQGHTIPEPCAPGIAYASLLEELSVKNPQAFVCHFYNVYFAHTPGGRIIGKKVAEKIHIHKELEFYQWEGDLSLLQQNVRGKLNHVASGWSRAEKDSCLDEMEKAFTCSVDLRRHMFMFP